LIEAAEGTDMFIPILIGFCKGMRRGEVLPLRWPDVDLGRAGLTVQQSLTQTRSGGLVFKNPKNKSSRRTISIPRVLVHALVEHRQKREAIKNLFGLDYPNFNLVVPLPDGNPWPPDRFTDAYVAFAKRDVGAEVRFHDLRHTHASELLRRGTPVKTVARRLGHANTKMTIDTHAHLMSDDERAAQVTQRI
jgi:integrase